MHRRFIVLAYRPDRRYRKHLHWMIDPPDVALRQLGYGYYLTLRGCGDMWGSD